MDLLKCLVDNVISDNSIDILEEDSLMSLRDIPINLLHGRRGGIESSFHPRTRIAPYIFPRKSRAATVTKMENRFVDKNGFQVSMNVPQFEPNELVVKTVDSNVCIEGKHEEREDEYGTVTRHFKRIFPLPKGYDPQEVTSTLSSDGILTIKAPPPKSADPAKERIIQIEHTGPAAVTVKSDPTEEAPPVKQNGEKSSEKMEV